MQKTAIVLAVALLLAGCSAQSKDSSSGTTSHGTSSSSTSPPTTVPTSSASTTQASLTTTTTGTTTTSPGNGTSEPPSPPTVLVHQSFTGTVPDPAAGPDAVDPYYAVSVPAGGTRIVVWYNTTYTGLYSAVATVTSPSGDQTDSLGACQAPLNPGAGVAAQCLILDAPGAVDEGSWTIDVTWQIGETTEDYAIDFTVYG